MCGSCVLHSVAYPATPRYPLSGTCRSFEPDTRALLKARMGEVCAGVAATFGGQVLLNYSPGYPPTINSHPAAVERVRRAATAVIGPASVALPQRSVASCVGVSRCCGVSSSQANVCMPLQDLRSGRFCVFPGEGKGACSRFPGGRLNSQPPPAPTHPNPPQPPAQRRSLAPSSLSARASTATCARTTSPCLTLMKVRARGAVHAV